MENPTKKCPHCGSEKVIKNGFKRPEVQNYKCKDCKRQFVRDYKYNGANPESNSLIIKHLGLNVGLRDMAKLLKMSRNTIKKKIKKKVPK